MADSGKSKAQLIAEIEAMRHRLRSLENRPGQERRGNYLLRIFIDALPNFAFSFDAEGRFMRVITGAANSEAHVLEGKLLADVLPGADAKVLGEALEKTFQTGLPQQFEFIISVMAGRRWFIVKSSLAKVDNDQDPFVVFLFQDITNEKLTEGVLVYAQLELKQKSAALTESNYRFSNLIDTSLQGIYVRNSQQLIYANQNFADLLGYDHPEEMLDRGDISQFCPPSERDRVAAYLQAKFTNGSSPDRFEHRGLSKDGAPIWLENLVQKIIWEGEEAILVTVLDISERKRAEEELRASERLLQTVFDSISHSLFVRDTQGRFLMVNDVLASSYGVAPAYFAGRGLQEIVAKLGLKRDWKGDLQSDRTVFQTGERLSLPDKRIEFPDGSQRTVHTIKSPLRDESGNVVGVVGVTEDFTERKLMEERLRETHKMEAVGQLAGGIAHDFNNLLQVIISYARFARGNLDNQEHLPEWLDKIIRAGERASALTRQILTYSRNTVLQLESVDLNELTSQFLHMVGRVIGADIELRFSPGDGLHPVTVDSGMIEQVLLNLCVNARDAMPKGGRVHIKTINFLADDEFCRVHNWEHPGDYIILLVSDNGSGMDRVTRERIFESFFTTKDAGDGTGLGMATVHRIVQQHKGKITVYSEPDVGTTIRIYLPKSDSAIEEKTNTKPVEVAGGRERILVVEDEEGVRMLLGDLLESKGYQVIFSEDGAQAIERIDAESESIQLVILDVVMPWVQGREVYEHIQKTNPNLAVIFSTGYSESVVDSEFLAKNDLPLIQKPYSPTELFLLVREVLDRQD